MGIIVKQSVRGTIFTYLGVVLGFITTGVLFPNFFSAAEVGLTKALVAYTAVLAQFGTLGINGVTTRLFAFFRDEKEKHHGFLAIALLVGFAGFILTAALLFAFKPLLFSMSVDKSPLFLQYVDMLFLLIFFHIFFYILDNYYTALLNSVYGTYLREILQRVLIIAAIVLFIFNVISFHLFVWLYVISLCMPTLFIVARLIRDRQFSLALDLKHLRKSLVNSMVSTSLYSILSGFSLLIMQNIDIIMINSMISLSAAGIYSVSYFFGIIVTLPSRSIYRITNIVLAEAWKENNLRVIEDIYRKSCILMFIISAFLYLELLVNLDNIFSFMRDEYSAGKWIIVFIGLGGVIDMATGANGPIIGTSRYYKVQTFFFFGLVLLLIIANLLLIPVLGIDGAAVGGAISLLILNVLRFLFLYIKFRFQPFTPRFLVVLLSGLAAFSIAWLIPVLPSVWLDVPVRSLVAGLAFGLPVYFLKISGDLNQNVDKVLKMLRLKSRFS